jgi:hypothetical protein
VGLSESQQIDLRYLATLITYTRVQELNSSFQNLHWVPGALDGC